MEKHETKLNAEEPKTQRYYNLLLQVMSVLYYILMSAIPLVVWHFYDGLLSAGFALVIFNMLIIQYKHAKVKKNQQIILSNQQELVFSVNMVTQGRGIRRKIKEQTDQRAN